MKKRYFLGHLMLSCRNINILIPSTCQGYWITDRIASSDVHPPFTCAFTPFPSLMLLKKEQRLSKAPGTAPWHGQSVSSTRFFFPSLSPRDPSMPSGFDSWGCDTVDLDMRFFFSYMAMFDQELLCNFRMGKESKESGRLLKSGGLKHCITSLHKYKQKKVCVMFQEYLLGLIWSMSVEKNLFCPCILPLTMAFFKQLLQKASGVCRYFRQSKI